MDIINAEDKETSELEYVYDHQINHALLLGS